MVYVEYRALPGLPSSYGQFTLKSKLAVLILRPKAHILGLTEAQEITTKNPRSSRQKIFSGPVHAHILGILYSPVFITNFSEKRSHAHCETRFLRSATRNLRRL